MHSPFFQQHQNLPTTLIQKQKSITKSISTDSLFVSASKNSISCSLWETTCQG